MVRMGEVGTPISLDGVSPIQTVGMSACVIFISHQKIQKMVNKDTISGYHTVGAPTCLCKQEVGKPSQNAVQSCAKAYGYINDKG